MKKTIGKTKKLTLCAVFTALGIVILYIGSIIEVLDLSLAVIVSLFTVFCVLEFGGFYPWLLYLATGTLSLLLLPSKFIAVFYLLFAGFYPILKEKFERLHFLVAWLLKLSVFNTSLILIITGSVYILKLPDTDLGFNIPVFLVANLAFVLYDVALTKLITLYLLKLRRLLGLGKYF